MSKRKKSKQRRSHARQRPVDAAVALRIANRVRREKIPYRRIAEESGVSESNVSHWINGRVQPPFDRLPGIARALDTSVSWLLTGKDVEEGDLALAMLRELLDSGGSETRDLLGQLEGAEELNAALREYLAQKKT